MNRIEFERQAKKMGVDRCYFLQPERYALRENSHGLVENPFDVLPSCTCVIALIQGYAPIVPRDHQTVPFSAYYIASNTLYHAARELSGWLLENGAHAYNADLPAKTAMRSAGIAELGEHTLMAIAGFGTRFAIQFILTDAFDGQAYENEEKMVCMHCGRCRAVCPGRAIGKNGFEVQRCLRWHMEGHPMPNWVKENIPSLFGCELCQLVCPRNQAQRVQAMPDEWADLFQYERLLILTKEDKKRLAALVGKNMISRGRVRAQTLCLARRFHPKKAKTWMMCHTTNAEYTENEQDVMRWVMM